MGAGESKQESDNRQQVFSADHPVRFSEGLLNSLQNNPETDSSRAKNLELIIQTRVTEELEKHLKAASERVSQISTAISEEPFDPSKDSHDVSWTEKPLLERAKEKVFGKSASATEEDKKVLDRNTVAKELEVLKKKLDARKKKAEMDPEVAKARESVVECLRKNDRRPLDCWKEVELFKNEVGKMERDWIERNSG